MSKKELTTRRDALKAIKEAFPKVYNKFTNDKDTNPEMSAAARVQATEINALLDSMTDEQVIGTAMILMNVKAHISDAGYQRMFGLAFPQAAANILLGPPTE